MTLGVLRRRIDRLDHRLLELLNRRALLVLRVGQLKQRQGQPIADPRREQHVVRQIVRASHGPLPKASVREIFRVILRHSRSLQRSR